jgi:hypothetical protein
MPYDPYTGEYIEMTKVMFNCDTCGTSSPQSERHVCKGLTDRQRRRIAAQRRLTAYLLGREKRPRPCEFCGLDQTPGRVHACRVMPLDKAAAAAEAYQTADLVAHLRRQGFVIEPKGSQDD